MELGFTMENNGTMEKNYGTMDKNMLLWKKIWYNAENYGTLNNEGKKKHGRLPKTKKP